MVNSKLFENWTLRFKPLNINEIQIESGLRNKFLRMIIQKSVPNLIIYGPPGSGKTTIVCKKNLENFLNLNASHIGGIDTVRLKIKSFCKLKNSSNQFLKKFIIIDEAESLTEIAQEALRRTVENFSNTIRFIFICNYPSKIIEAIQSRCTVLRFKSISDFEMLKKTVKILHKEKILFSIKALEMLVFIAEGDMRRLLNESEIISRSFLKITDATVKISCFVPIVFMIADFLYFILNKNHLWAFEIFIDILNEGYSLVEIINGIFKFLKKFKIFAFKKIKFLKILCEFQIVLFEKKSEISYAILFFKKLMNNFLF
nr:DNA replication factor C complex subunit Rfc2 [Cryptomonas curvata]